MKKNQEKTNETTISVNGGPEVSVDLAMKALNQVRGPEKTETMELMCDLTDAELIRKGEELTAAMQREDECEAEIKNKKETLKGITETVDKLRRDVQYKQELRNVECRIVIDREHSSADLFRVDTGEFVQRRELKWDEKNPPLPFKSIVPPNEPKSAENTDSEESK